MMIGFLIWNTAVFLMYGLDKFKAKRHMRRIPEKVLLGSAFLGGALGAAMGMEVFHHKTRKYKFTIGVPIAVIFNISVIILLKRGL